MYKLTCTCPVVNQLVFRDRPDIARKFASAYERTRRAETRRLAKKKAEAAKKAAEDAAKKAADDAAKKKEG